MSDKEIILLFKKDNNMTEQEWTRFCRRYALRDTSSVVAYLNELYGTGKKFPKKLKNIIRKEIKA